MNLLPLLGIFLDTFGYIWILLAVLYSVSFDELID